jgi:hypothetical protein
MTIVNPQITDSVTEANVKVLGDAPAMAMGNLYQATAQALANAAHNAVATQQQVVITAMAVATQGVAMLYSVDTASLEAGAQHDVDDAVSSIKAAVPPQALKTSPEVVSAIGQLAKGSVGAADDVAYGMRAVMSAVSASLDNAGAATVNNLKRVLQLAAMAACFTAMVAHPEKAASYEEVLKAIKSII